MKNSSTFKDFQGCVETLKRSVTTVGGLMLNIQINIITNG